MGAGWDPPEQRAPEPRLGVLSTWGAMEPAAATGSLGAFLQGAGLVSHWFHWEEASSVRLLGSTV